MNEQHSAMVGALVVYAILWVVAVGYVWRNWNRKDEE